MLQRPLTIAALTAILGFAVISPTVSVFAAPQKQAARVAEPRFENYPATPIFKDSPAALIANNEEVKSYEDTLKTEIKKGTNFAGYYVVVSGLNRAMGGADVGAIVDLKNGKVYLPKELHPYHDQRGAGYNPPRPDGGLKYETKSNLLVVTGRAGGNDGNKGIGKYYYKWENNQLKLIKFVNSPYNPK